METFSALRKRHPTFSYKSYSYRFVKRDLHLSFDFFLSPDIYFKPSVVVKNIPRNHGGEKETLENLSFHIGMIEILSYWKAACSPVIIIEAGFLNKEQLNWWKDLILRGMGEFFFRNKIDYTKKDFLSIKSFTHPKPSLGSPRLGLGQLGRNILVPVGGGKDAIVSLEILKKAKKRVIPFVLNPSPIHRKVLSIAGYKNFVYAERIIDPKLLDLNRKGYLNGHTPFSAYLAFLTALVAVLFNAKHVMVSNERSSNEGNARYKDTVINHQYSKTFEFERKFRFYSKKYLVSSLEYMSFLRPLYELQIAKLFAKYPKYFKAFLSCNSKGQKWCSKCAKCLFVFIALYPFLKENRLVSIFKKNLFQDAILVSLLEELTGEREVKPFECVGTRKETLVALFLSLQKQRGQLPILLKYFKSVILPKHPDISRGSERILTLWNRHHFLPRSLSTFLKKDNR